MWKMLNQVKDTQNKARTDAVWKRYMSMSERDTNRSGTNEPLINNKEELIEILEALENDNLVMYAAEDNQVIVL